MSHTATSLFALAPSDPAARFTSQLLYELFSRGRVSHHGVVFSLRSLQSRAIQANLEVWWRFGYVPPAPAFDGGADGV